MGKFINEDYGGLSCQGPVQVELLQYCAAVFHGAARQDFQPFQESLGFLAAMRLDEADDNIRALRALLLRRFQHGIGFPNPGRSAEKELQLTFTVPLGFPSRLFQKLIGIRPVFVH